MSKKLKKSEVKTIISKSKFISVRNARLHNLKEVSVEIPRNKITVITGVSGSGKSSLAFDTIYAEGQRRFVESLSSYARQFLERKAKPDVDSILGLPPAIAIQQLTPNKNPRSTVGTTTEIYDYFRLVFGRIGKTICKLSGKEVKKDTPESIAKEILQLEEGSKLYILFSLSDEIKDIKKELSRFFEFGYSRIVLKKNDEIIDLQESKLPTRIKAADFYILVDRVVLRKDEENITRLTDSIETAFTAGNGKISIKNLSSEQIHNYSNLYEDAETGRVYIEPEPKLFSFNNPFGACPICQGFGNTIGIDKNLVIPDLSISIERGAIAPFKGESHGTWLEDLIDEADKFGIDVTVPIGKLDDKQIEKLWKGFGAYEGINSFFQKLEDKNYKIQNRVTLARFRGYTVCPNCDGSRLRTSARQVFVNEMNVPTLVKMSLNDVANWVDNLQLDEYQSQVVGQVIEEIKWRLQLLVDIGLDYLSMDRLTHTLSGGEYQRINLSTALGSSLVGTLYVLDEPSIGLHPRDTQRLINILAKLRNLGNTIIVVEHDPEIMKFADYIIDMGPKAGEFGGEVIFAGKYEELIDSKKSLTADYLLGRKKINIPEKRDVINNKSLIVLNAKENNLNIPELEIPLNAMVVFTGVSGSGKSTLVSDIIYAGIKRKKGAFNGYIGKFEKIIGTENIEEISLVDQSSIGVSSRSTPATYTKVFDHIRDVFAGLQEAKQLGWKAGYFSFNVEGGRCDVCQGEGEVHIDMQFLPDITLECEDCKGTRYKREVRNLLYKGKSIVDVLGMSVDEAYEFFIDSKKITNKLTLLRDVGLGYMKLGQQSSHLSGGEAQRIKLASYLETDNLKPHLFIFDEPTTGLHLDDISKLLTCFQRLVDSGHSVFIIEHNLNVIASADWIIDLGPDSGIKGGNVVATGNPKNISTTNTHTGIALNEFFEENIKKK